MKSFRSRYFLVFVLTALTRFSFSQPLQKDTILDSIRCRDHSDQSYALYIPPEYESGKEWPVIMIFDASARARLSVSLFKEAGKKFGYIIACSDNSRNGPMNNNLVCAAAMLADLNEKYRIDPKRIFVAGFSGGSRFAMAMACMGKGIAGVIGCGAGLPNDNSLLPASSANFIYYGLAGTRDMNYLEMHELEGWLSSHTKITPYIRFFNGGHQWPDAAYLTDAVQWIKLQEMNKGIIPPDQGHISPACDRQLAVINTELNGGNQADAVMYLRYAVRDFQDKACAAGFNKMLSAAERSPSYTEAHKEWTRISAREQSKREDYVSYLSSLLYSGNYPDSAARWWQSEIGSLKRMKEKGSAANSSMASRLMNFISILCSDQGTTFYRKKVFNLAVALFAICTQSDSENPLNYYNLARSKAGSGDLKGALEALIAAADHGFNSRKTIESDPVFGGLKENAKFKVFLLRLK
jgi:dienelactone hydrolase